MKPTKLHIPQTEKSSPFFTSPYPSRPPAPSSQLSPIPDNSPSSFISSPPDSQIHPKMLEAGSSGLLPGGGGGGRMGRWRFAGTGLSGGMLRRVVFLVVLLGMGVLVLHRNGGPITLQERYSTKDPSGSTHHPVTPPLASNEDFGDLDSDSPPHAPAHPPALPPTTPHAPPSSPRRPIDISSDPLPLSATLPERLAAWRSAPGARGELPDEPEPGRFVQYNLETCSTISEQHNTHMIQHSANVWASMNRTLLHSYREELIQYMEAVAERGEEKRYGEGKGIVMVAGNADTLTRVKWSLQMLRSYDSELPVQIYHFPSERLPDDDPLRAELGQLGAELVEAQGQERDKDKNKSYHLKALAVVQCPWREVLYLDSDSIPTRDPAYMFDAPNYRRLGIWATPDYWKTSANNPMWAILGVKCRDEWEMETGQMFVDKKLHLDVFLLIKYMLENHEFWFAFSDGDKDIFRWALLALRKRWAVPGRWVGAAALPSGTASGDFCSHTMLQHDSFGEPLFVHYNLLKQIPSGVGRGFSWGRTKQLPLFNTWPATGATARLGEPERKPEDTAARGLGDVDCDMLADAGEDGRARAPAKEMIMRRAARERGVKVKYHGGWISALCIDLEYIDPRPKVRQLEDATHRTALALDPSSSSSSSDATETSESKGEGDDYVGVVEADWGQSPIEIVQWRDDEHLAGFEKKIYDFGFKPSGPGF